MAFGTNKTITVGNPDTGEMIEITPARIIHFVNIHDELVDKLEEVYELLLDRKVSDEDTDGMKAIQDLLERAKVEA